MKPEWEYKVVHWSQRHESNLQDLLNTYGSEGWELVSAETDNTSIEIKTLIFKRVHKEFYA